MKDLIRYTIHTGLMLATLMGHMPSAQAQESEPDTLRVLSIGNSFSRDAFAYVPFLIEELSPQTPVDWGILYIGGCSLERHWNNWVEEKAAYQFDRYRTGQQAWNLQKGMSLQQGLAAAPWDIIVLQQQSARSRYYDTYQPYLNHLLEVLKRECPMATPAWLLTQAYGEGHGPLKGMSSDEMWARIDEASERVIKETDVQLLIPAGTAIQNARYTTLDRLGRSGHLVYDGYHLHEGIAPLIEGLCAAHVVLKHRGVVVDVEQSRIRITPEWRQERATPEPHGEPQEASEQEYATARRCAKWALEAPWQLTVEEQEVPEKGL